MSPRVGILGVLSGTVRRPQGPALSAQILMLSDAESAARLQGAA